MTERLYYNDSFLLEFDARVEDLRELNASAWMVKLDRTAFYPSSGGQPFDIGTLNAVSKSGATLKATVEDVFEDDAGEIWHRTDKVLAPRVAVHCVIDGERRRDHMQQHSGQHVLSAAFVKLFNYPTVSFHLGEESCSIDLQCSELTANQIEQAERLANEVIAEDRPVAIRYAASLAEAQELGLRKLAPREGKIRLIDIADFDLNACGGTHVRSSGQIGCILVRKTEKVKQGARVEFVCGLRAVKTARADFSTLTEAAAVYSTGSHELPAQLRRSQEELKTQQKAQAKMHEELAELMAAKIASETPETNGRRTISRVLADRDAAFAKLLAQKLSRAGRGIVVLLAVRKPTPTLIFARSQDVDLDVGTLLKELVTSIGGRGGGGKDLAQGGVPEGTELEGLLAQAVRKIG